MRTDLANGRLQAGERPRRARAMIDHFYADALTCRSPASHGLCHFDHVRWQWQYWICKTSCRPAAAMRTRM